MTTYHLSLACTIILLMPMLYFLIASPSFLLVRLEDPTVTWLLRGLINVQFALVSAACAIGAAAFALAGRPIIGVAIGSLAAVAFVARRWFLRRMDAGIQARDSGDADAVRRLRRLHWVGMAYNAAQFVAIVTSLPFLFASVT